MNAREMHIEIRQSLSQVGANRTRSFLDEELDLALNKIQDRFIQNRLKPKADNSGGFELDQIGADSIRTLIVSARELTPYMDPSDPTRYFCYLPADYQALLSDWSYTKLLCGADPAIVNKTLTIYRLRQDYTGKSSAPFYQTMSITMGSTVVGIPTNLPYQNTYTGYQDKADISFLIPWILRKGNFYWENFGEDLEYPGHYLVPTEGSISPTILTLDGTTISPTVGTDVKNLIIHSDEGDYYDNRLTASNDVSGLSSTAFLSTSHYAPISELGRGVLFVYRNPTDSAGNFIVSKVGISYVRKPQPINLSLNTGSELPPSFHHTLCDLVVEYLKGRLENEKGKALATDDIERRVTL